MVSNHTMWKKNQGPTCFQKQEGIRVGVMGT